LKTWQFISKTSKVAYALIENGLTKLTKLHSIGKSKTGMLGQGRLISQSRCFTPMAYEATYDNQFRDMYFVGESAIGVTIQGEIWILGGQEEVR
jgi:hypothetical protein